MDESEIQRRIDRVVAEFEAPGPEAQPELADYDDYLHTALWARIRKRVIRRDGGLCRRCGGKGRQVHHRCYDADVLRGERIEPLVTLCDGCHEVVERDDSGQKRAMAEKDRVLFDLCEGVDLPEPAIDRRGDPIRPEALRRATAVQRYVWWRVARRRAEIAGIRRSLARPGSSVKRRHPRVPELEMGGCDEGVAGADVVVEEMRFQADPGKAPCWVVGRITSPEDRAWLEVAIGERRRAGALRVLAGTWPFRVRAHSVGLDFPADGRVRLVSADGKRVIAERVFRIAEP